MEACSVTLRRPPYERAYAVDLAAPEPVLRFYTEEKLSEHQELTPEGFLLIRDAPIARTGSMVYTKKEMPWIDSNGADFVTIERLGEDVFDAKAIASFNGKPITNNHPPEKVTPDNYRHYSVGTVLNPRQGDGENCSADILYADLLVKDKSAIHAIQQGRRELSAGYDAKYTQLAPGIGRQQQIVGNHVALVDAGRCGARCAIMDEEPKMSRRTRALYDRLGSAVSVAFRDAADQVVEELQKDPDLRKVISGPEVAKDEDESNGNGGDVHVHVNKPADDDDETGGQIQELTERVEALEEALVRFAEEFSEGENGESEDSRRRSKDRKAARDKDDDDDDDDDDDEKKKRKSDDRRGAKDRKKLAADKEDDDDKDEEEKDDDDEDRKKKSEDSKSSAAKVETGDKKVTQDTAALSAVFQDALARAEILAPGIKHPTFDAKQGSKFTLDALCDFRREALTQACKTQVGFAAVREFLDGREPKFTRDAMTCDAVAAIFNASSQLRRLHNNGGQHIATQLVPNTDSKGPVVGRSAAELNKSMQQYYRDRGQIAG